MQMICIKLPVAQLSLRCWHAGVLPAGRELAGLQQVLPGQVASHTAGAEMLVRSLREGDVVDCTMYCGWCLQEGDSLDCKGPIPKLPYKANMKKHIGMVRNQHSENPALPRRAFIPATALGHLSS